MDNKIRMHEMDYPVPEQNYKQTQMKRNVSYGSETGFLMYESVKKFYTLLTLTDCFLRHGNRKFFPSYLDIKA